MGDDKGALHTRDAAAAFARLGHRLGAPVAHRRFVSADRSTVKGKLRLLDAILRNKWITPDQTLKLQCLGVTFGDALAQKFELTWIAVEDDYGRDAALTLDGTSVRLFPFTSISKRIERGEEVEVYELFENACRAIERLRREGA